MMVSTSALASRGYVCTKGEEESPVYKVYADDFRMRIDMMEDGQVAKSILGSPVVETERLAEKIVEVQRSLQGNDLRYVFKAQVVEGKIQPPGRFFFSKTGVGAGPLNSCSSPTPPPPTKS